jgi:hypothetical protein
MPPAREGFRSSGTKAGHARLLANAFGVALAKEGKKRSIGGSELV